MVLLPIPQDLVREETPGQRGPIPPHRLAVQLVDTALEPNPMIQCNDGLARMRRRSHGTMVHAFMAMQERAYNLTIEE